ncbi:MAG: efflux RND transporter periplasmic adaptor subunit [Acidobacteriaceae bacterium]|nr:efflux RND transporter periplasmic adaptor subunit [Acidobacteriaceae bacterium]MBV9500203.1 efflux RND transporter periplasmic adaptor subunit [Acidobacteriaceae bacterium]
MKVRLLPASFFALVPFLPSCNRQTPVLEKTATPVRLSMVENYTPSEGERYSASILPNRQVNLAFRVSGFVESMHQVRGADGRMRSVDIGDIVRAGTVLAQVRMKDYELQVSQADGQVKQARQTEQTTRAQLQQAEAAATKAEQDFARADALFKKNSLTKSDYDSATANRDSTRAQVEAAHSQVQAATGTLDAAQSALGTATLGLHDTSLTAPFKGAVVQRSIELGMLVGPSLTAFVLADVSSVKATFGVPDISVASLRKGSKLSVYAEAFPSRQFQGFVSAIAAAADSSTRAFQVEVTIPNERAMLRPGMIASLDVGQQPELQAVTVAPLDAIVRSGDDSAQFAVVVVDNGIARRRPVSLGSTYGDRIAITGVQAGQKVVSSGATFVSDGDAVKVIP